MSSAAAERSAAPVVTSITAGRPRVLVTRSCRIAQFTAAVRLARDRNPGAEIVAISHAGHERALKAAGADRVIAVRGRRFGVLHVAPAIVARLRRERFAEVIIPQMSADAEAHSNVYRFVAALGAPRITLIPGDEPPQTMERSAFARFAARRSVTALLSRWDVPGFLLLLLIAGLIRRPLMPAAIGRRRRVLHVISTWGVGGAQVQLAEVLNRTPLTEFEVDLLVLGRSDGEFSRQWLRREDITVSFVDEWPKLVFSVRAIADRCREGRYDIVHTWLFMANMTGAAAARLAGVPLVIASVRNLSVWKREAWYRKWWHRLGDALGSRCADVVTVNAQALVADHAQWAWMSSKKIEVIHNGLDPARLGFDRREGRRLLQEATGAPATAAFIGTVGRLAQEKDQATFLRILAAVCRERPEVHGVIVGNGELRSSLERLSSDLGLEGAVTFLGERSDARPLTAGFDLFVLTSRSEGFPNVLLEATFMRVPCVATNIAGNPDVLEREETLFPVGDVQRGAEQVLAALADVSRTQQRTDEVRQRAVELFTAERSVGAWLDLYRRHIRVRSAGVEMPPAASVIEAEGSR